MNENEQNEIVEQSDEISGDQNDNVIGRVTTAFQSLFKVNIEFFHFYYIERRFFKHFFSSHLISDSDRLKLWGRPPYKQRTF